MNPTDVASLFSAEEIYNHLGSRSYIKRVFVFDTIGSTNSHAKKIAASVKRQSALVLAERQTRGRGRFNRRWQSEKGKNLTFSLLVHAEHAHNQLGVLSLCVAESVARAVEQIAPVSVETKWPNDLLIDGKKFCGILLETVSKQNTDSIIVGIGLNVNQEEFPPALDATSLRLTVGADVDRMRLLLHIVNELQWLAHSLRDSEVQTMLNGWKERSAMLGKTIVLESGDQIARGVAKTVAPDGALIVKIDNEERKFYAGDVSIAKT